MLSLDQRAHAIGDLPMFASAAWSAGSPART
jgi:hypothetical protein